MWEWRPFSFFAHLNGMNKSFVDFGVRFILHSASKLDDDGVIAERRNHIFYETLCIIHLRNRREHKMNSAEWHKRSIGNPGFSDSVLPRELYEAFSTENKAAKIRCRDFRTVFVDFKRKAVLCYAFIRYETYASALRGLQGFSRYFKKLFSKDLSGQKTDFTLCTVRRKYAYWNDFIAVFSLIGNRENICISSIAPKRRIERTSISEKSPRRIIESSSERNPPSSLMTFS